MELNVREMSLKLKKIAEEDSIFYHTLNFVSFSQLSNKLYKDEARGFVTITSWYHLFKGYCHGGQCRTHDDQCGDLWTGGKYVELLLVSFSLETTEDHETPCHDQLTGIEHNRIFKT